MPEKPDLLISANGRTGLSTETLTDGEILDYLDKGWRRVPFDQHVEEAVPRVAALAFEEAAARIAKDN